MITKFKLFESINLYPTEVFHGSKFKHDFSQSGKEFNGTFFTTEEWFAEDYTQNWNRFDDEEYGIIYKVLLKPNLKLYDTSTLENCTELINKFGPLEDCAEYYEKEEYVIHTPEKLYNMAKNKDNWYAIEFKPELIQWVSQSYDGIIIFEDHVKNILLFSPVNEKIISYTIISNHPDTKFKENLNSFKSYLKLNENPETIKLSHEKSVDWLEDDAYAFGIRDTKVIISQAGGTHGSIGRNNFYDGKIIRSDLKYPGRIWVKYKCIAFWVFPPKEILINIIKELESLLKIDILNDEKWQIEIVKDDNSKNWSEGVYDGDEGVLIPLNQYTGSSMRSKEELDKEHILSPLLKKKSKEIPIGFGSKHPKTELKFKEKIDTPFESYYIRKRNKKYTTL